MIKNIKAVYAGELDGADRGEMVSTLIITAGFAIAAILFVNWVSTAMTNKSADVAQCIEGSSTYASTTTANSCENADHSKNNSFKNDKGYQGRYTK